MELRIWPACLFSHWGIKKKTTFCLLRLHLLFCQQKYVLFVENFNYAGKYIEENRNHPHYHYLEINYC